MRWGIAFGALALTACGRIGFTGVGGTAGDDANGSDVPGSFGPWGTPMPVTAANSTSDDISATFNSDGTELWVSSTRGGPLFDLWKSTRPVGGEFGAATHQPVPGNPTVAEPTLSKSDLVMYIKTEVAPLSKITRATTSSMWTAPVAVAALDGYRCSDLGANDLRMVMSNVSDDTLFEATRPDVTSEAWTVKRIDELAPGAYQTCPCMTDDGLEMMFQSDTMGGARLYDSHRIALDAPWSVPTVVDLALHTEAGDCAFSQDATELVFDDRNGADQELYIVTRERQ